MTKERDISESKFAAINKTFLQVKDIAVLLDCSLSKAGYYRKKFIKRNEEELDFFKPMVRTSDFITFYKIDVERIRENYKMFFEINGSDHFEHLQN